MMPKARGSHREHTVKELPRSYSYIYTYIHIYVHIQKLAEIMAESLSVLELGLTETPRLELSEH